MSTRPRAVSVSLVFYETCPNNLLGLQDNMYIVQILLLFGQFYFNPHICSCKLDQKARLNCGMVTINSSSFGASEYSEAFGSLLNRFDKYSIKNNTDFDFAGRLQACNKTS